MEGVQKQTQGPEIKGRARWKGWGGVGGGGGGDTVGVGVYGRPKEKL